MGLSRGMGRAEEPATLIVVRHGETVWNAEHRWQGWLDSPLTARGEEQARRAAEALDGMALDHVYSSDVGRALRTAEIIVAGRGLAPEPVAALRERNYGGYEGLNREEIEKRYPGTRFREGTDRRETWRPPDGETFEEVRARVRPFLAQAVARHAGQTVLMVTHSGTVRVIDGMVRGCSLDDIWHRHPPNACVYVLRAWGDGRFEVVRDMFDGDGPEVGASGRPGEALPPYATERA